MILWRNAKDAISLTNCPENTVAISAATSKTQKNSTKTVPAGTSEALGARNAIIIDETGGEATQDSDLERI